jgi:formamidopyrimidine-DNA glycosylase
MIEIPEAQVIAEQLIRTVKGKRMSSVVAAASPHKFTWYFGDPADYPLLLEGRTIDGAAAYSSRIEIEMGELILHLADGASPRYYGRGEKLPVKHQLLLEFEDGSALVCTVAMYGGIWCFKKGEFDDNIYARAAKEAVPVLSDGFNFDYFLTLLDEKGLKMSAKAFLATEQRIPGLGNGVLQDILLNAKIHPKKKMNTLSKGQIRGMFDSLKSTLAEMRALGGRDTERDLFGNYGGYRTKLSKNTVSMLCPNCGGPVKKENYLGGSIYYCDMCQEK